MTYGVIVVLYYAETENSVGVGYRIWNILRL